MNVCILSLTVLVTILIGSGVGTIGSLRCRRCLTWLGLCVSVGVVEFFSREWHPVLRMLWLIAALFWSMKAIVYSEWLTTHPHGMNWKRRLMFWMLWPGMRPDLFARDVAVNRSEALAMCGKGLLCVVTGWGFLLLAMRIRSQFELVTLFSGWIAMLPALIGLSLMLHFGAFNLIAGFWRGMGLRSYELFRSPLEAKSLEEFWGRRWNLAFTEMTAWSVFRPLRAIVGTGGATFAAFLVSGLLHELAITVPVSSRYGFPTLYFLLQWSGIVLEQRLAFAPNWLRRSWAIACVVLPLPLVFPPEFVQGICEPVIALMTGQGSLSCLLHHGFAAQ